MSEPTTPSVPAGPSYATGPIPPYFGPMGRTAQTTPQPRPAEDGSSPAGATAVGALAGAAPTEAAPDETPTAEAPTLVGPAVHGQEPADVPVAAWALTGDEGPARPDAVPPGAVPAADVPAADVPPAAQPGTFPTTPVSTRPTVRARRRDPLTRMGPWAPAAGALLGLVAGLVVVVLLAGRADGFGEALALVFLVVGLTMLGAAGALLADEVRIVRRGAREAAVRPAWVEATANLVNGLTPARLLLGSSAFVLFLAAYVGR